MSILNIAISLVVFFTTIGGLAVFLRNPKEAANRIFLAICLSVSVWIISYSLIEIPNDNIELTNLLNSLAYASASVFAFLAVWLTFYFPRKITSSRKILIPFALISVAFTALSLTSFVAGWVIYDPNTSTFVYEFGAGLTMYVAYLAACIVIIGLNLVNGYKNAESQKHKSQARYLIAGFIVGAIAGLLLAVLAPIISPESSIDELAPFSLIVFLYLVGKAIVEERLYNFRIIISQVFTFVLTYTFIVVVYLLLYLVVESFDSRVNQLTELILSILFTVAILFNYHRIHSFFGELVRKAYLKDAYDPQQLLDSLNQDIVKEAEIEELIKSSSDQIRRDMHANSVGFYIRETAYIESRFICTGNTVISRNDLEKIRQITPSITYKVHSVEVEPKNNEEKILNDILRANKIEVLVRLVDTVDYKVAGVGYLVLGPKRSGALYSDQDLKVLEIIANELVIAVENALRLEEIEQFNVTLQKKIDEATKELKQSNEKLKALDEAKDEFVSMASHQLRTPLTSIKGYLSMVLEGDAGKLTATQKQMLGQAFFSSQRMVYLISDLLNVSRLKTGKFIIEPKEVNLPNLVEDEIEQLQEGAKAKDITLAFVKPKEFSMVELDEMKIRQVVMNFVDNGIYYTPSGEKITVDLKETDKTIEFTVKDSGIGVPKKQQHKLFTKFYRADNARKARPDGTGLGLFMAKKVIVAQGGSIIFKSTEGKGSTFGFSFPKKKILVEKQ